MEAASDAFLELSVNLNFGLRSVPPKIARTSLAIPR
jgi:hypothetical protein